MNQTLIEQRLNFVEEKSSLGCFLRNYTLSTRMIEAGITPASSPPPGGHLHGRCCEAGWTEVDGFHITLMDKRLPDSLWEAKQGAGLSCPLPPPTSPPLGHEPGPRGGAPDTQSGPGAWSCHTSHPTLRFPSPPPQPHHTSISSRKEQCRGGGGDRCLGRPGSWGKCRHELWAVESMPA